MLFEEINFKVIKFSNYLLVIVEIIVIETVKYLTTEGIVEDIVKCSISFQNKVKDKVVGEIYVYRLIQKLMMTSEIFD